MSTLRTFLLGVSVGTIVGVLYAPNKGSITRRRLSERGEELRDQFNDLKSSITDKIDSLRDNVNDMAYEELEKIETDASSVGRSSWQS